MQVITHFTDPSVMVYSTVVVVATYCKQHLHAHYAMCSCNTSNSHAKVQDLTASIPSPVDTLARVLEVQLDTLVNEASIPGHDNSPSCMAGGHAGYVKAFLPFLVDPLERKAV